MYRAATKGGYKQILEHDIVREPSTVLHATCLIPARGIGGNYGADEIPSGLEQSHRVHSSP
jgi:hypothetical protein